MVVGLMYREYRDIYWLLGFPVAIFTGAILGLGNGLLVTIFSLPSIIVTLGTLSLYRGLTFIISDARQINRSVIPTELKVMSRTSPIFDIPWIILIAFGIALMTFIIARHTQLGRQIYALGSNPEAAPLRGIDVTKVTLIVFTLAGALSGLAGILYASRWGFVNPSNTGAGFEFQVIAAVVIGGVSINGGIGTVMGTVLGVLLLGCVAAALPLLGIPGSTQNSIYGAVILIALLIDRSVRQGGIIKKVGSNRMSDQSTTQTRELAPARSAWHVALVRPETMTFLLLIFGLIGASYLSPFFLDINYILRSFTLTAEMSIVALVLTMVIISGEIDLSPAANMALSACIFAWVQAAGAPIYLAVLVALFAGLAMGALNAFMSIRMQLPSIIVTIGTLIFFRGLAQVIAGDKSIRVPDSFIGINTVMIAGIPLPGHNILCYGYHPWLCSWSNDNWPTNISNRH